MHSCTHMHRYIKHYPYFRPFLRLKDDEYKATAVAISKTACFFKEVCLRRIKRVIGDPAVSARGRDVFRREI